MHLSLIPTLDAIAAAAVASADAVVVYDMSAGMPVRVTVADLAVAGLANVDEAVVVGGGYANQITVTGAAASGVPVIAASGDDTNISLQLRPKGGGTVIVADEFGEQIAIFGDVSSAVNELTITNAATGGAPSIAATGDDTDIDLALTPKGAGTVKFGTHSALGGESVTGFITITDAGGTARKIAVVS